MKLFVFGIDGASYEVTKQLMEEGKLPTFKKIADNGYFEKLMSTTPPHTAPGWVSSVTGVGPGTHGVYQFWDTQARDYVGKFMGSMDINSPTVWEILNSCGISTGMCNIPMTHPPKPVDGFIITWPLSNTLRYSYPEDILYKIAESGGHYASDLTTMCDGSVEYIDRAIDITKKRVKTIQYLLKNNEYDFFMTVFTEVDRISHFYWNSEYQNIAKVDAKVKLAVENIYIETDKALASIMNDLPSDALLMVLSDHGFCSGKLNFYVQTFLYENELLCIKEQDSNISENEEINFSEISSSTWLECIYKNKKYVVDWENTVAFMAAPGSYGVNINLKGRQSYGIVEESEYDNVVNKIIEKLIAVTNPNTNEPLFKSVLKRKEVYSGERLSEAPDIILIPNDYGVMVHHSIKLGQIFGKPEQKGMHREDGVLFLYGNGIDKLQKNENARLEDITPTILNYYNIGIPAYMEGKVLYEFNEYRINNNLVIKEEKNKNEDEHPVDADSYSEEEKVQVENKLKALGYL